MPHRRREAYERELTGIGRGRLREARWRPELLPNDRETWGKRSAMVRGLGQPKESANGRVARRLGGNERVVVLTLAWRMKWRKG
jgi:hypothetical protein